MTQVVRLEHGLDLGRCEDAVASSQRQDLHAARTAEHRHRAALSEGDVTADATALLTLLTSNTVVTVLAGVPPPGGVPSGWGLHNSQLLLRCRGLLLGAGQGGLLCHRSGWLLLCPGGLQPGRHALQRIAAYVFQLTCSAPWHSLLKQFMHSAWTLLDFSSTTA